MARRLRKRKPKGGISPVVKKWLTVKSGSIESYTETRKNIMQMSDYPKTLCATCTDPICCAHKIITFPKEIDFIFAHPSAAALIVERKERLREQIKHELEVVNPVTYFADLKPCFLQMDDGRCGIYDVRQAICCSFLVVPPSIPNPKHCYPREVSPDTKETVGWNIVANGDGCKYLWDQMRDGDKPAIYGLATAIGVRLGLLELPANMIYHRGDKP